MPLSSKGKKLMKKFIETYGNEKAKEVFYASKNKGTIEGVEEEVKGTASPQMQAMIDRTAVLKAKKERAALMKANKEKAKPENSWTVYNNMAKALLGEGKQKQERIKSDKERTAVGASSSNDPKDPRYSPSMTSRHNSPENIKRREIAVGKRSPEGAKMSQKTRKSHERAEMQVAHTVYKNMAKAFLGEGRQKASRTMKAGAQGVTPMSDKQKKNLELKAQEDSNKDLEL